MTGASGSTIELAALELLESALEQDPNRREAYIASRDDLAAPVRERAHELLLSDRDAIAGLQTGGAGSALYGRDVPPDIPGYHILRQLGRGGMGAVWLGQRVAGDFDHTVAIKVIRPGVLSDSLIERFRRERQILAQLNHPNIARLYDGGETEENQPYIVMEYVAGETLRHWLTRSPAPGLTERLALIRQTAVAVGFAHQNLVIHRDLTPGNVLVDAQGQAKLIDFGIAMPPRTVEDQLPASALTGLSLTPGFAAPERARGEASNTLTDVYSLGKILELAIAGFDESELAAIAARAAAEKPEDRYHAVSDMVDDLDSYEAGGAIDSFSTSRRYRFGKFARREKILVASGVALFLALAAGLSATSWSYLQAERARDQAERRFAEVRDMANFMLFDLDDQLQRTAGNTAARTALVARAQRYLSALAAARTIDPALRLEAARGFNRLAQVQGSPVTPNLGLVDDARKNLAKASRLLEGLSGPTPEVQIETARNGFHRAMIALHADADQDGAGRFMATALAALDAVPDNARDRQWRLARAELRQGEGELLTLSGQFAELEKLADRMEADIAAWPNGEREGRAAEFERANADVFRGRALHQQGRAADSLAPLRAAVRRFRALDERTPNDPLVLNALAWAAYEGYGAAIEPDPQESARFLALTRTTVDRLVALESADMALRSFAVNVRQAQAEALGAQGNHVAAAALQREVVELRRRIAAGTPDARSLSRLGVSAMILGNIAADAGQRQLACEGYAQSSAAFARARRLGPLIGMNEEHATIVSERIAACR